MPLDWNRGIAQQAWEGSSPEFKERIRSAFSGGGAFAKEQAQIAQAGRANAEPFTETERLNSASSRPARMGIADPSPALDSAQLTAAPGMDASDAARMDRLRQLNTRVALNQAADTAIPTSTPRQPSPRDPLATLRSPAETALRQSGGTLVDNLPMGVDPGQRVVAQPSRLVGGSIQDGIPRPNFQTDYGVYGADGQQGSMTITGPDRRAGGGTLSVMDQGNGGTVEGNVAGINRQIAALRDLREAQNPGITTGQAGRAFGDTVSFGKPGGGFGQEQLDANRSVSFRDLPFGQPGDRAKRRDLLSLMEMQQRGQQFDAAQMGEQEKVAMQQQAGILKDAREVQQAAANRQWEQAKFGQQFGLDQQRLGVDQQRAGLDERRFGLEHQKAKQEAVRQGVLDESTLNKNARVEPSQIKAELMRRYLANGPDSADAKAALDKLFPPANPLMMLPAQ